ncbi:hypothetical protein CF335_g4876 [Tilletia laevis]|nr:hypothetical protein CF335_g4876 [Tilletia laevis]
MPVPTFKLNNGVEIPAVQMGVWQGRFDGGTTGLDEAVEVGYRAFDTAMLYKNEAVVGQAIRNSGIPRSEFFVTTKLANDDHHRVPEAFQTSLKELNLEDPLDLWLMHWPGGRKGNVSYDGPPGGPTFNETWAEMEKVYDTKRVRAIGVSNFSIRTLEELFKTARIIPAVNQVEGHPYLPDEELKAYCDSKGIHLTYYSPLGSNVGDSVSPILGDKDLKAVAEAHNVSVGQIALSWAVQRGISVAPRSTNKDRMKQNLTLVQLSDEEIDRINNIHKSDPSRHTRLCNVAWNKEKETAGGITYAWDDSRIIDLIIGFVVIGLAFCADQVYQGERATIPLRILKNRTVGFGSLVKFCVAAAYVSLLYFLPIYFQSVQRSSAIRSGVQTLPLIMAVIVFMTATGIMVSSLQVPPWCRSAAVCYTCSGRTFPKQHGLAFSYSRVLDLVWHGL